ncbi:MAG TPA: ribosome silencing factor [Micavibrio sp.]|nr:ribosome silencing factor [Micavibrio sp.]
MARLAGAHAFLYICQTFNSIGGYPILTYNDTGTFDVAAFKDLIQKSLDDDKAQDIQVINLSGQSALADYIIVASGTSSRHITSMAEKLCERLAARGSKGIRTEGMAQANWVVVDAGDVIVHLFRPEVREFYNIEKMWSVLVPGDHTAKSGGLTHV